MEEVNISRRQIVIFTTIVMVVLVAIFNHAMCWLDSGMTWNRFLVWGLSIAGVICIPFIVGYVEPVFRLANRVADKIIFVKTIILFHKKQVGIGALIYTSMTYFVWLLVKLTTSDLMEGFQICRFWFLWGCVSLAFFLIVFSRISSVKVEMVFAGVALILGMTTIFSGPRYVGITPDDETHFARSISLVSLFDGVKYEAETKMLEDYSILLEGIQNKTTSYEDMVSYTRELNDHFGRDYANNSSLGIDYQQDASGYMTQRGWFSLVYIPSAVAIIIARGLDLPFSQIFMCGKMGILFSYISIIYFAIKRLKYGKILMAFVALIPSGMILASSYSYDWWVTAFLLAGFSYYISALQYREKKLSVKDIVCMLLCFVLGVWPKWIYCVLMLPLFFIPKDKFESKKQRGLYYLVLFMGTLLVFLILILPILIHGLGQGDIRGGVGVNATVQLILVFEEPWRYIQIMLKFMRSYISLDNAGQYLTNMGYLGDGEHAGLLTVVMGVLAFLDRDKTKIKMPITRIINLFAIFFGIAAVITVFYLVFTPVGAETVLGCQARYLIPFLFPVLYFVGVDGTSTCISTKMMALISVGMVGIIYLVNYWSLYISYL